MTNFSTFLSCLYWGSALLYLIVDNFFRGLAWPVGLDFKDQPAFNN